MAARGGDDRDLALGNGRAGGSGGDGDRRRQRAGGGAGAPRAGGAGFAVPQAAGVFLPDLLVDVGEFSDVAGGGIGGTVHRDLTRRGDGPFGTGRVGDGVG